MALVKKESKESDANSEELEDEDVECSFQTPCNDLKYCWDCRLRKLNRDDNLFGYENTPYEHLSYEHFQDLGYLKRYHYRKMKQEIRDLNDKVDAYKEFLNRYHEEFLPVCVDSECGKDDCIRVLNEYRLLYKKLSDLYKDLNHLQK